VNFSAGMSQEDGGMGRPWGRDVYKDPSSYLQLQERERPPRMTSTCLPLDRLGRSLKRVDAGQKTTQLHWLSQFPASSVGSYKTCLRSLTFIFRMSGAPQW
jgi:hypothetical protein